jgi:hypothetical protein
MSIRPAYGMWPQYNRRVRDVIAAMTDEQLAIRPAPDMLPIWADDLDHPRTAGELAGAFDSTFAIVDGCLDRWTFDQLTDEVERHYGDTVQVHTRGSILQRLLTHEAWHAGELSQTFGIHGLQQPDLWRRD